MLQKLDGGDDGLELTVERQMEPKLETETAGQKEPARWPKAIKLW